MCKSSSYFMFLVIPRHSINIWKSREEPQQVGAVYEPRDQMMDDTTRVHYAYRRPKESETHPQRSTKISAPTTNPPWKQLSNERLLGDPSASGGGLEKFLQYTNFE